MELHRSTVLVLVVAVALAGCAGGPFGGGSSGDDGTQSPTATPTQTETPTSTPTPTATPTATPPPTATPTATWNPPPGPNRPTENKTEPDRFMEVQFVDVERAANGSGVTNFDLDVLADTRLPNVDPGPEGTENRTGTGEPYFLVKINGTLIAQTDVVDQQRYGTYPVAIPGGALDRFDAGTLDVQVVMLDRDSHRDDVYRRWNGTIEYAPN